MGARRRPADAHLVRAALPTLTVAEKRPPRLKPCLALLSALLVCLGTLRAQDALSLYHWEAVPKRLMLNPAAPVSHRAWLSLPGVGHFDQAARMPWGVTEVLDLRRREAAAVLGEAATGAYDDVRVDVPTAIDGLRRGGQSRVTTRVNLLSAGVRTAAGTFSLNLDQQVDAYAAVGPSPLEGLYYGEAFVLSEGVDVSGAAYDGSVRTALSLGFQRAVKNTPWRLGANVKLVKTQAHARLRSLDVGVAREADAVAVTFTGAQQVGGWADLNERRTAFDALAPSRLLEGGNLGLGFDLGVYYAASERLTLSASLTDVGFQRLGWEAAEYGFRNTLRVGDSEPLSALDVVTVAEFSAEADELSKDGRDTLTNRDAYTRPLPGASYLGAEYRLGDRHGLGLVIRNSLRGGRLQTASALSLNLRPSRLLEANASVSYSNVGGLGFGLGTSLQLGPVQVYAGSDNVLGLVDALGARRASVVAGLTLLLPDKPAVSGPGVMKPRRAGGGRGKGTRCYRFR